MSENLRRAVIGVALAAFIAPGFLPAYGYEDEGVVLEISDDIALTLTGELRTRYEWDTNLVDFTDDIDDEFGFVPSRARFGVGLSLPRDVSVFMEFQELWSFGEDTGARLTEAYRQAPNQPLTGAFVVGGAVNEGSIGNILTAGGLPTSATVRQNENARVSGHTLTSTHRDDLSLYQGYIQVDEIGGTPLSASFGRQEYAFGNEWLLGDNDFYGGASLDGIKTWWDFDRSQLNIFWAKVDEQNTGSASVNSTDDDTDLWGAYWMFPEIQGSLINLDAYAMLLKSNYDGGPADHSTNSDSWWIGARVYRQPEWGFHFNAELTYQFGDITVAGGSDMDIQAWGFEGSGGYTWDVTGNPDLHVGFTYASGDDDPADNDYETFAAPMPDPHPRLGFADLVSASNILAYQIGYAGSWNNQAWGIEVYRFELAEDRDFDGDGEFDDDLGNEIDLWYAYQYSKNVSIQLVYAMFLTGDVVEDQVEALGLSADDAQRFYANLVLKY
jgi:hypothetical protein